jgi:transketolase
MESLKTNPNLLKQLSNCIRILSADAVEKAQSGHPGMPLGMADVMTILALEFLRFDPANPKWPSRDRLVLSAGHGSMLLYSFYYLAGYKDFTIEDIKNFRQLNSKTPGHPEYGAYPAIETSTGPLGQGLANAVGMAIAAKKAGQTHKIYVIVGDGCLMEGIAYEAISLAGHLRLDNLIVIFDDNKITIDGDTSLTISENHQEKFHAMEWNSFIAEGHDFGSIRNSLQTACFSGRPAFIACKTTIGYGSPTKAGFALAHGSPLGKDEIVGLRTALNWHNFEPFFIPEELLNIWRQAYTHNINSAALEKPKHKDFFYDIDCPTLYEMHSSKAPEPSRVSSGRIVSYLMHLSNKVIVGSADLSTSNNLMSPTARIINHDDYDGNFIHYGPREHAMAAIMNGLALEGFKVIGGTFLVFSDYMRPSIRLACLMNLPIIYVFTHDSIGLGEDGPTHQPVEHLASLRAMPNLLVMRPADYVETVETWQIAWGRFKGPTVIALSRQTLPAIRGTDDVNLSARGAYPILDDYNPKLTIFSSGSELSIAMQVGRILQEKQIPVRVVSVVCMELFAEEEKQYQDDILYGTELNIVVEAGVRNGWEKFLGKEGMFFGVETYGHSAPYTQLYEYFGLVPEKIAEKILERL